MGFGQLKVKAKAKSGRGCMDNQLIEDAITDSWTTLTEALEEAEDDDKAQIKEHFNGFSDGNGNLGDILFGDADGFKSAVADLNDADKAAYFEELFNKEIIDKQSIEDSLKE